MTPRGTANDGGGQRPVVIVLDGSEAGRRVAVGQRLLIGRSSRCDLTLAEQLVSRTHAEIVADTRGVTVLDLGSANGTFVNGAQVEAPVALADGDTVRFGEAEFTFKQLT